MTLPASSDDRSSLVWRAKGKARAGACHSSSWYLGITLLTISAVHCYVWLRLGSDWLQLFRQSPEVVRWPSELFFHRSPIGSWVLGLVRVRHKTLVVRVRKRLRSGLGELVTKWWMGCVNVTEHRQKYWIRKRAWLGGVDCLSLMHPLACFPKIVFCSLKWSNSFYFFRCKTAVYNLSEVL